MSATSSAKPGGGRGGLKALITVGALAATAIGWLLFSDPAEGAAAAAPSSMPSVWAEFLSPLPTLVPEGGLAAQSASSAQPVLRRVNLPAPAPVTITRSSR